MPGIVEFPTIVERAAQQFGAVFANAPERRHFAEYLTGLLVAAKKNVSGINAEFAETTDQSCLNRWITEVAWDEVELNLKRLAWLQQDPQTRYDESGVIPIDNTLVSHDGKLIEDVGYFWDHAEERYKIAHDYLIANYVCRSGKHYALEFRRFRKQADCEAKRAELNARVGGCDAASEKERRLATFKNHTLLYGISRRRFRCRRSTTQCGWRFSDLTGTARSQPRFWRPIKRTGRSHECCAVTGSALAGTETLHRDGKQHLGLGDCQMRSGEGQTRHIYLVLLAHSLLIVSDQVLCSAEHNTCYAQ
ncbi:MAG: transposase, partial [Acidobacteriota bacterium]